MVYAEITVARKNILFSVVYHTPSQSVEQFEMFISGMQTMIDTVRGEHPHSLILTGDFNCRSAQWWPLDEELPEVTALEELIETNYLC